MQGHFIKIYFRAELSEAQCGEWMHLGGSGFTSAGASIRRHGVSIFGTCALVTPGDVHTLIGAQLADALRTLVDVLGGGGGAQRGSKSCEIDAWTCSNTRLVPIRYL